MPSSNFPYALSTYLVELRLLQEEGKQGFWKAPGQEARVGNKHKSQGAGEMAQEVRALAAASKGPGFSSQQPHQEGHYNQPPVTLASKGSNILF